MVAHKKRAPCCHICATTRSRMRRDHVSENFYSYGATQELGCLKSEFHTSALPRLRGASCFVGPSYDDPSENRVCAACYGDWQKHMATGGLAGRLRDLQHAATAARIAAGRNAHPMAHGDMRVIYWMPGEPVGLITEDTLVVRKSDDKAIFCFIVDAFGKHKDSLAAANFKIAMAGHPCKRGEERTADGVLVVTGYRLCRHDNTMARYNADNKKLPFENIELQDLSDETAVLESECFRLCMPCQWAHMQAQIKPGTFATLGYAQQSTPFGLKSVSASCAVPNHIDGGDVCSFIGWTHLGEGLPPLGGRFHLFRHPPPGKVAPEGPGIEVQPAHGSACFFNTAEFYHGTDALEERGPAGANRHSVGPQKVNTDSSGQPGSRQPAVHGLHQQGQASDEGGQDGSKGRDKEEEAAEVADAARAKPGNRKQPNETLYLEQ